MRKFVKGLIVVLTIALLVLLNVYFYTEIRAMSSSSNTEVAPTAEVSADFGYQEDVCLEE